MNLQISPDREKVDKILLKKGRSGSSVLTENLQKILAKEVIQKARIMKEMVSFKKNSGQFYQFLGKFGNNDQKHC